MCLRRWLLRLLLRLSLRLGGQEHTVRARRVVLALPPRVAQAGVRFEPALPAAVDEALQAQPTWMATAAKAANSLKP